MRIKRITPLCLCIMLLIAWHVRADEPSCPKAGDGCVQVGEWDVSVGLGIGRRTNPVISNDDIPIYILPSISYYGERLFWETDTIGFTLLESPRSLFNVITTVSYGQTYFNDWGIGNFSIEGGSGRSGSSLSLQSESDGQVSGALVSPNENFDGGQVADPAGDGDGALGAPIVDDGDSEIIDLDALHERDMAALAGFEYLYDYKNLGVSLQVLKDISGVHNGMQVRTGLATYLSHQKHGYTFSVGAEWKDSETQDYYYGVRLDELENDNLAYIVDDDWSYYAKFDWRYQVSKHWEWRAIIHHRWLGDEIKNSPLVNEATTSAVFFGGVYHF
ncbi:MAG: MipA/OmpV family protein [Agarilytica sp.]